MEFLVKCLSYGTANLTGVPYNLPSVTFSSGQHSVKKHHIIPCTNLKLVHKLVGAKLSLCR